MREVAIIGVYQTRFGKRRDVTLSELALDAIKGALEDSNVDKKGVGFLSVGNFGLSSEDITPSALVAEYAGLDGISLMRCEAACASGAAAFYAAWMAVSSGMFDLAVALGVEKMTEIETPTMIEILGRAGSYFWEFHNFGVTFPAYYAFFATAHMKEFGTTEEDLALVAVKNHKYGAMNPKAQFREEITVDDVLSSRVIAWPLKLYDCCPISDGAAAVVLASKERVKELGVDAPVWIRGIGVSSDSSTMNNRDDFLGIRSSREAAQLAYRMAKVRAKDIEVAEVHDCFTIAEILAYEDLGFCRKGEGAKLIREGETEIEGRIPVNVDGGLKAKGHPLGATGISMLVELTMQLREEVEPRRQVPLKKYLALAHNVGGTGQYCYVTILSR
ncbi:MAG TPA: thiolase domain-containing protein [Candidatus Korarchaeota archaeon]|nr:thiolase domain-containing protein [Candidatus Korarchaeota archaeon]